MAKLFCIYIDTEAAAWQGLEPSFDAVSMRDSLYTDKKIRSNKIKFGKYVQNFYVVGLFYFLYNFSKHIKFFFKFYLVLNFL